MLPAADRDYRRDGNLTAPTAVLGWAVYLLHWGNVAAAWLGFRCGSVKRTSLGREGCSVGGDRGR